VVYDRRASGSGVGDIYSRTGGTGRFYYLQSGAHLSPLTLAILAVLALADKLTPFTCGLALLAGVPIFFDVGPLMEALSPTLGGYDESTNG